MPRFNLPGERNAQRVRHRVIATALAIIASTPAVNAEPERLAQAGSTPPQRFSPRGAVYVDIETDRTGAVARLVFLNKVPPEIQEWIKSKTLGRHFGVPNHTYRRHVEYEVPKPPKAAK